MSRSSLVTFVAATLLALATTGCPSPTVVEVKDPGGHGGSGGGDIGDVGGDENLSARARLAQTRARHLDELRAYWQAGQFPINEEMVRVANIFKDDSGKLCAVANMMAKDGLNDLIDQTAKTNNLIRLADVHEGPLYEWMMESGFTQEEIAMIQVPYMPPRQLSMEEERERLQRHLSAVEDRLRDDTEQSLDVAMMRLAQHRAPAAPAVVAAR